MSFAMEVNAGGVAYNRPNQNIPRRDNFLRVLILRFRIMGRGRQRTIISRAISRADIVTLQTPKSNVV